ncbi:MAG: ABC transporter ATP-binding protein [Pseudomonadota bacterium]
MNKPVRDTENQNISKQEDSSSRVFPKTAVGVSIARGISFENVCYQAGKQKILDNVSFEVSPGEVLCLLGPSGSGKTSLLQIAAGLIEHFDGTIKIDNREVGSKSVFVPPEKRGVGLVFQDYALFPHLTLIQNIEFGLNDFSRTEARKQAEIVLKRVGMEGRAHHYPHVLSGGEQQRIALARALAPRPGILLMDEPFSGLDSRLRDTIREQSIELLRETRSTAIIVTHDAEEALRVGDQIALIRDGQLVQRGTAQDLYYNPVNLFAAAFFSEINVMPAHITNGVAETVFGSMDTKISQSGVGFAAVRYTDVGVRPFAKNKPGRMGRISARRFLGTTELLDLVIDGLDQPFQARIKPGEIPGNDTSVLISVDPKLIMIFPPDHK